MFSRPGFALRSVIHECDTTQAVRFHAVIFDGVVGPTIKMLREVIERGITRGEVRSDAANGYVFDAIPAMMVHRSKMCGCEWRDQEIEEMIDQLMVSLLRSSGD
ncbi:transcriptional regulator [Streptomyces azureus]|uniref:Transcriptional regulator n=1 Tax=Streptomyces azureus TaxID=146537 RepID=A0A0K8PJS3_STRAJ|nr:transcriptional regulator [Streptomyces azureus]